MNTPLQASARTTRRTLVLVLAIALLAIPAPGTPAAASAAGSADDALVTSAWAWGSNDDGQIGDDSAKVRTLPVPVRDTSGIDRLDRIVAIAASDGWAWDYPTYVGGSVALDADGTVWAWGDAANAREEARQPYPAPVRAADGGQFGGITAIAAGGGHTLALDRQGTVWTWESRGYGQYGEPPAYFAVDRVPKRVWGPPGDSKNGSIVAISAGLGFSLALDRDGTVWSWGAFEHNQLGRSTSEGGDSPWLVQSGIADAPLGNIVAVAAGTFHGLALDRDGHVWTWGGIDQYRKSWERAEPPVTVLAPDGTVPLGRITAIAARGTGSVALDADGHVWTWATTAAGQPAPVATAVPDAAGTGQLGGIVALAKGRSVALAIDRAGRVWAWGDNHQGLLGQGVLGIGTTEQRNPPVLVRDASGTGTLGGIVAVAVGYAHALALDRDGHVWAWGRNRIGQLGESAAPYYRQPILVRGGPPTLDAPVAIDAGPVFSLALDRAGRVWAWGRNAGAALGDGTTTDRRAPVLVRERGADRALAGIVAIADGGYGNPLALGADGTVWAWGGLEDGGDTCAYIDYPLPCALGAVPVRGLPPSISVADGLALDRDGRVWTLEGLRFSRLVGLSGIVAIADGLALDRAGRVWTWGDDRVGQLGDGPGAPETCTLNRSQYPCASTPVRVPGLGGVVAIAASNAQRLALLADGTVLAWGSDGSGELGDGPGAPETCTTGSQEVPCATSPMAVPGLTGIVAVTAGGGHTLALSGDGHVWAWGCNSGGQLGDGTTAIRDAPVPVLDRESGAPLVGVVAIAAGSTHSLALRATDPATERCFPQSGYCLRGAFLAYWQQHGGLALNGYPLSATFTETLEDGKQYQVQYLERARLEYHPENAPPHDVLLGQFGRRVLAGIPGAPTAPVAVREGYAYFASTGHNVRLTFFAYWDGNGGLAQFGLPLSEEFTETLEDGQPYTVQYFERARFEWHPEHVGTPYEVLLGQFGRRILAER